MNGRTPTNVGGLIFDVGDVLYDGTHWRRWLFQLLVRMGLHQSYADFFAIWERAYYTNVCLGHYEFADAMRRYLADVGFTPGQIDEVCTASRTRQRELDRAQRPFPGVRSTLARLAAAGMPMAALSNTPLDRDQLERKLDRLGLRCHFKAVLSSRELNAVKPSAEAYRAAMEALELSPDRLGFVGHDHIELEGAAHVGLTTIAVYHPRQVQAQWQLERIEQLTDLVSVGLARAA